MARRLAPWLLLGWVIGGWILSMAACSPSEEPADERPRYLTTIPPFRAILEPVVGERGTVTALLKSGGSPHTYEPRPSDSRTASQSTALIFGARHLDEWAAELPAADRIALMDLVPEPDRLSWDEATGHAHGGKHDADPHFWTDPMTVRALLPAVADTLCHLDADGCDTYRANADAFAARLVALDAELEELMEPVRAVPVMLAQPFFRYFMHRYGPKLIGVVEPNPGAEPSARALQRVIRTIEEHKVQAIFTQEQLPPRAARAVAEASGVALHTLDPIGGTPDRLTYADLVRHNARVLSRALTSTPSGS